MRRSDLTESYSGMWIFTVQFRHVDFHFITKSDFTTCKSIHFHVHRVFPEAAPHGSNRFSFTW